MNKKSKIFVIIILIIAVIFFAFITIPNLLNTDDKLDNNKIEPEITIENALEIATNSECTEKGVLSENYSHNAITNTWWIDLTMKPEFENQLCSPACVVNEITKTAEINWRCTGAITE